MSTITAAPGHRPKKSLGQNFLRDHGVIHEIIAHIRPQYSDCIVEIGPGLGALTYPLAQKIARLCVIELDHDLAKKWDSGQHLKPEQAGHNVALIGRNVLDADIFAWQKEKILPAHMVRLVGNLPYHLSSAILLHFLPFKSVIQDQHFMLQKEVVDRMLASPKTKDYGRLSVMMQAHYAMHRCVDVDKSAFYPVPKVQSSVVAMRPLLEGDDVNSKTLEDVTRLCFAQRRKMLRAGVDKQFHHVFAQLNIDMQQRAEELSVVEYLALARIWVV